MLPLSRTSGPFIPSRSFSSSRHSFTAPYPTSHVPLIQLLTHYTFHPSSSSRSSSLSLLPPLRPLLCSVQGLLLKAKPSLLTLIIQSPLPFHLFTASSRHHVYSSLPVPLALPTDTGLPYICNLPRCLPSALASLPSTQGARVSEEGSAQTQKDCRGERPPVYSTLLQTAHLLQSLHRLHMVTHARTDSHTATQKPPQLFKHHLLRRPTAPRSADFHCFFFLFSFFHPFQLPAGETAHTDLLQSHNLTSTLPPT